MSEIRRVFEENGTYWMEILAAELEMVQRSSAAHTMVRRCTDLRCQIGQEINGNRPKIEYFLRNLHNPPGWPRMKDFWLGIPMEPRMVWPFLGPYIGFLHFS